MNTANANTALPIFCIFCRIFWIISFFVHMFLDLAESVSGSGNWCLFTLSTLIYFSIYLMQWIGSNTPGTLCSLVVILVFIDMTLFGAYQVSLEYFNSIAAVYFCVSVMISVNGNIYHNQYAIKVTIEIYIIFISMIKIFNFMSGSRRK